MRTGLSLAVMAFALMGAAPPPPVDDAAAFGAREAVSDVSLSPDGTRLAYIAPAAGQGARLFTIGVNEGDKPVMAAYVPGTPDRLGGCDCMANDRLACRIYGVVPLETTMLADWSRLVALDADGKNLRALGQRRNGYERGVSLRDGAIIDLLPDENGTVLMMRDYLPNDHLGSRAGSSAEGLGVDRVDTRTLATRPVERPRPQAFTYLSDGRGTVRIAGARKVAGATDMDTGVLTYSVRRRGAAMFEPLSERDTVRDTGFRPVAVDHDLDVAYGFDKLDGRQALYTMALDGTAKKTLVFARPDVDVDGLVRIGRRARVVGATFVTDKREATFFDPGIARLIASLGRALPGQQVRVVDSSVDESKLLIFASSDRDPGVYYLFDKATKQLKTLTIARDALEGRTLSAVSAVRYPAADGTMIPGYLTLPPGQTSTRGLPAIVLPHGGPAARDEWGFDWLAQYYAARGYAVLQPNFRGSAGYGDRWFQQNGFRSWRTAVGDVADGGRWLVAQGADPAKLGIVGWSYGGYAALLAPVIAPGLFRGIVAIAPVTDLAALKQEAEGWSNARLVADFVGTGAHIREGSPAQNAGKIGVPVLLAHGTMDTNVRYRQSADMEAALKKAGGTVKLLTFPGLDHQLEDSAARTTLLSESDAFLKAAFARR